VIAFKKFASFIRDYRRRQMKNNTLTQKVKKKKLCIKGMYVHGVVVVDLADTLRCAARRYSLLVG